MLIATPKSDNQCIWIDFVRVISGRKNNAGCAEYMTSQDPELSLCVSFVSGMNWKSSAEVTFVIVSSFSFNISSMFLEKEKKFKLYSTQM